MLIVLITKVVPLQVLASTHRNSCLVCTTKKILRLVVIFFLDRIFLTVRIVKHSKKSRNRNSKTSLVSSLLEMHHHHHHHPCGHQIHLIIKIITTTTPTIFSISSRRLLPSTPPVTPTAAPKSFSIVSPKVSATASSSLHTKVTCST